MATVKRINGDYTLKSATPSDSINILTNELNITADVEITGNLSVVGSLTQLEVTETTISDPIITLGAGNNGSINEIGIEVQKDGSSKAGLRWNTALDRWELSKDNVTWEAIAAGAATLLSSDPDPTLSAPLNAAGQVITDETGDLTLTSATTEVLINASTKLPHTSAPTPEFGFTKVYAQPNGGGSTGLYVASLDSDLNQIQEELISKSRAIIYSIIF